MRINSRSAAACLILALLAGSVSAASFAAVPAAPEGRWSFSVRAGDGASRLPENLQRGGSAGTQATASNAAGADARTRMNTVTATPADAGAMLGQSGSAGEAVHTEWFALWLDQTPAADSRKPGLMMSPGHEIPPDGQIRFELNINVYVTNSGPEDGDDVIWRLGRIPGLNLPEESWDLIALDGHEIGEAVMTYSEDGEVGLRTEFYGGVREFDIISIRYTYESGFAPVSERTVLPFMLPGWEEEREAVLLPTGGQDESRDETPETPETETTAEPTSTEPETTEPETSMEPETSGPETSESPQESAPQEKPPHSGGSGGSGDYSSGSRPSLSESGASALTGPGMISRGEPETALQADSPAVQQEVPVQPETKAQPVPEEVPGQNAAERSGPANQLSTAAEKHADSQIRVTTAIITNSGVTGQADVGSEVIYQISLKNEGDEPAKNLRARIYLPEHTSFVSLNESGSYHAADGRQYGAWSVPEMEPGESRELKLVVRVFPCTPTDYFLENRALWDADVPDGADSSQDPRRGEDFPVVRIR